MTRTTRNDIPMERLEVDHDGRSYRVTGRPTVVEDRYPIVEVYVAEIMVQYRGCIEQRRRSATWRRLPLGRRCVEVRVVALKNIAK